MAPQIPISRYLLVALLLLMMGALFVCAYWGLSVELVLTTLAGLGLSIYLIVRFPEWFLVAALFAPQWKTLWGLQRIDRIVDLTVVMLFCLAAGILWRIVMSSMHSNSWSIQTLFFGQLGPLLAFLVFACIVAVSYSYTNAPDYGASKLARFLAIGSLLLIAPFYLILAEDNFRRFARIFVGFSGVTAVQLIVSLEFGTRDENTDITRIGAGWLIGMAIILLLFYPLARSRGRRSALYFFVLPILIAGLVASAARGPMVALAVAVFLGLSTLLKHHRIQGGTVVVLLFVVVAGFIAAYYGLRQADLDKYTAKAGEFKTLLLEGASTGSAGKRLDFYRATLAAIPSHFLLGTGVGSWSMFYYRNDSRNYPHNLVLEITFEEGLVGLTAFAVVLLLTGVSTMRMLRESRSHFLALGLLVLYCVIVSMFSGDLDDNRVLWLWIGVTLAICRTVRLQWKSQFIFRGAILRSAAGESSSGRSTRVLQPLSGEKVFDS